MQKIMTNFERKTFLVKQLAGFYNRITRTFIIFFVRNVSVKTCNLTVFCPESKKPKDIELTSQMFQTMNNEVVSLGHLREACATLTNISKHHLIGQDKRKDISFARFTH